MMRGEYRGEEGLDKYSSQGVFRRYLVSSGKKEKVDPFPRKFCICEKK